MRGVSVPEAMRMHGGIAGKMRGVDFDNQLDSAPAETPAAMIKEQRRFRGHALALGQIALERRLSLGAVGNLALLPALAANAQPAFAAIDVFEVEARHFAHAQP